MPKAAILLVLLSVIVPTHSIAYAQNRSSLKTENPEKAIVRVVSARSDRAPMPVASKAGSEVSYDCSVTTLQYMVEGVPYLVTSGACPENQKRGGQTASIPNR